MFSIVVPVYNVEDYIYECLESIAMQTNSNLEVILVDDGSTDNSSTICRDFASKNDNFVYLKKMNGGLSDARNFGLRHASKEYVIFVDGDDYIDKSTVENLEKYLSKISYNPDILVGEAYSFGRSYLKKYSTFYNLDVEFDGISYYKKCLVNNYLEVPTWLHIYRREFLIENNLFFKDGIFHEDEEHTVRCYLSARSIIETGLYFYYYRIREGSIMTDNRKFQKRISDLKDTYNTLRQKLIVIEDKKLLKYFDSYWVTVFLHYFMLMGTSDLTSAKQMISPRFISKMNSVGITKIRKTIFVVNPKIYLWIQRKYLNYRKV